MRPTVTSHNFNSGGQRKEESATQEWSRTAPCHLWQPVRDEDAKPIIRADEPEVRSPADQWAERVVKRPDRLTD